MTKILFAALFVFLAGSIAGYAAHAAHAAPTVAAASELPPPTSFDREMPAPQEPLDLTPITAVETVGASRTE